MRPYTFFVCKAMVLVRFRNLIDQPLGLLPSETGIRDGFSVDMVADLLAARLQIALDHHALYERSDGGADLAVVHNFFDDAHLLSVLLSGIFCRSWSGSRR